MIKKLRILIIKLTIEDVTLVKYRLYTYNFTLNIGTKYYNRIHTGIFTKIHIHIITFRDVFYDGDIFFTQDGP